MTADEMRDRPGTRHDDELSKRTDLAGVPFTDMAAFNEDTRIMAIGRAASGGKSVACLVDSDECEGCKGKADRYIKKIRERFPDLIVTKEGSLTPLTVMIKVSPPTVSKAEFLKG